MKSLFLRLVGGISILALTIFFTLKGGYFLFASVSLLSSIGLYEIRKAFVHLDIKYPFIIQILFNIIISSLAFKGYNDYANLTFVIAFMWIFGVAGLGSKYRLKDAMAFVFSLLYVGYIFSYLLRFEKVEYILFVYICSWGCDTFAYMVGMLIGKNKLIEKVSPNKTIEGSVGGIIGAMLLTFILTKQLSIETNIYFYILIIVASIVSQIGDLCASSIKRLAGIKDYSKIILGHGGVLDRFDSVIFVIPIVYGFYLFFREVI